MELILQKNDFSYYKACFGEVMERLSTVTFKCLKCKTIRFCIVTPITQNSEQNDIVEAKGTSESKMPLPDGRILAEAVRKFISSEYLSFSAFIFVLFSI